MWVTELEGWQKDDEDKLGRKVDSGTYVTFLAMAYAHFAKGQWDHDHQIEKGRGLDACLGVDVSGNIAFNTPRILNYLSENIDEHWRRGVAEHVRAQARELMKQAMR